jgi:hypothetical protein
LQKPRQHLLLGVHFCDGKAFIGCRGEIVVGRGISATVARGCRHYSNEMRSPLRPLGRGPTTGAVGRMSTPKPGGDADRKRLDIARRLYQALVAQNPDRLIMLCDGRGRVLALSERRPKEDATAKAS